VGCCVKGAAERSDAGERLPSWRPAAKPASALRAADARPPIELWSARPTLASRVDRSAANGGCCCCCCCGDSGGGRGLSHEAISIGSTGEACEPTTVSPNEPDGRARLVPGQAVGVRVCEKASRSWGVSEVGHDPLRGRGGRRLAVGCDGCPSVVRRLGCWPVAAAAAAAPREVNLGGSAR